MRSFIVAFEFLTIVPSPLKVEFREEDLGRSMSAFPLVGFLLGGILVLLNTALSPFLTEGIINIIILAFLVIITGGLHIDGFMDTLDGIASSKKKDTILRVMRDSNVGAIGVIGAILLVLLKWEALNTLLGREKIIALLLMPAIGRWGMTFITYLSPYVRKEGLGHPFAQGISSVGLCIATLTVIVLSILLAGMSGVIIILVATLLGFIWSTWFGKKIGGITGDVVGAFNEILEMVVLLIFSII